MEYRIPTQNLQALERRLDEINRKAAKLGCQPVEYKVTGTDSVPVLNERNQRVGYRAYTLIEISGEAPRLADWDFMGVVDSDDVSCAPLLKFVPGIDVPVTVITGIVGDPWRCDHCQSLRRRHQTFLVHNQKTDMWSLVGRSCLRDYTGHTDPGALAAYYSLISDLVTSIYDDGDLTQYSSHVPLYHQRLDFLAAVCQVARQHGYISSSQAKNSDFLATADEAWRLLDKCRANPTTEDVSMALAIQPPKTSRWPWPLINSSHPYGRRTTPSTHTRSL
jgi:hypothetical protein